MLHRQKNTIPVYDISSLDGSVQVQPDIVIAPFAPYLEVHPNLHAPHRHDFYHMVLFTAGEGFHTIDFERFPVKRGQVYCMIPGQVHSWNFKGKVDGYVLNFSDSLLKQFLKQQDYTGQFSFLRGVAQDCVLHLPEETFRDVTAVLKQLLREVKNAGAFSDDMISAQLVMLLVTLHRSLAGADNAVAGHPNHLLLQNFRRLVDEYYPEKHLPKEYAALLYITPNHLNALCKDLLGKPAGMVIRDRILLEAKRMLVNMSLPVADISDRLHFSDHSYFTKFFRKYTGMTPEAFRRKQLEKAR